MRGRLSSAAHALAVRPSLSAAPIRAFNLDQGSREESIAALFLDLIWGFAEVGNFTTRYFQMEEGVPTNLVSRLASLSRFPAQPLKKAR